MTGMLGAVSVLASLAGARARRGIGARVRAAASASTSRCSASTLSALVNQAQNAFVSGVAPGPSRQRPSEHRPVRDVRDRRRRDRGRGRLGAAVAAGLRGARPAGAGRRPALRHERRPRRAPSRAAPDPRRAVPRADDAPSGSPTLEAADIPAGPINDILAAFASPGGGRPRDDRRAGASGVGRHPPGRRAVRAVRDAGLDPDPAAAARRGHRRDPGRGSATTPTAIRALRDAQVV